MLYEVITGRSMWESDLFTSDPCPTDLVLSGNLSGTDTYAASNTITSTNNILAGANITFSAGTLITLNPGFNVATGATFNAIMNGCNARVGREVVEVTGNFEPGTEKGIEAAATADLNYAVGNYPNPFRSHTWVTFQLAEDAAVTMEVFNLKGERVALILKDDARTAGTHTRNNFV